MKISDILREDKTTISFEVFPPKTTANFESVKKQLWVWRRCIPIT